MDNNQTQNQNDNNQYLSMVNYLISQLNKAKVSPLSLKNQSYNLPIFLYEFFVFELYLPSELLKYIKQPILAFRLLDFPSLTLEGSLNLKRQSIIFDQGKSSFFEMNLNELKENLINQPMYIMFLDLNHGNIKIIGNCRLNISLFAYDSFLNYGQGPIPEPRRNILQLFDNKMEKIGEFEMTLLIRREYYKFDKNIEVIENRKATLIKKAKKQRQILSKENRENLMYKGKEKPKEIIYDNNKIANSKYTKPQFINNIILEKQDTAFNAHPINKEIIIKPKNEEDEKYPEKGEEFKKEFKKEMKKKIMKCNAQTETELLPGVDVPINQVNYHKKYIKKKKPKKDYNIYQINQKLINSKYYNKYQINEENVYPKYELCNNNNSNGFNDQNQNNINNNNKNDPLSNKDNTYLNFLNDLKSKVNNYTNNLIQDKKLLEKVKEERNISQPNNLYNADMNMNNNINQDVNQIKPEENNNNINNQKEDIKKPESDKKSESSENLETQEKLENNEINKHEERINENNNINKNVSNDIHIKNIDIIKEEKKEDEENDEYNDFEKSKISEHSILDNKFNNQNQNINVEEKNEFDLIENINDNNNNIENNNNIQSEKDIKEETSLLEKNRNNQEIKVDSGEINEEIDENLNSQKKDIKSSIKEDINSNSDNKAIGSSSTENIERILKS